MIHKEYLILSDSLIESNLQADRQRTNNWQPPQQQQQQQQTTNNSYKQTQITPTPTPLLK